MRYLIVLAALAGCASNPAVQQTCIDARSVLGSKIKTADTGKIGVVTKIYGPTVACKDAEKDGVAFPIMADVEYE